MSRRPGGPPVRLSERQLQEIADMRRPGSDPVVIDGATESAPIAWTKIAIWLRDKYGIYLSGERVRTLAKESGMETSDGRAHHMGTYIPWSVRHHHMVSAGNGVVYEMLKRRSNRLQGRKMRDKDEKYLDEWLRWMDGANEWTVPLAVHYSPIEGFSIRRRRDVDDGPVCHHIN